MDPQLTVPAVLLAGVVSFASPCFLPVVPVFVGYMAGQSAGHDAAARSRGLRWGAAGHAATFMAAFTLVFGLLWGLARVVTWVVANKDVLRIAGGVLLVLLGLYTARWIRLPFLDRTLRADYNPDMRQPPTMRRSFLLGLAFGAGWTPCIGAMLGAVLTLTATTSTMGKGLGLLLVYAFGLGIPFVLVSAGVVGVTQRLSWFTRHARAVGVVTGLLLIVVGFLMISDLFIYLSSISFFEEL